MQEARRLLRRAHRYERRAFLVEGARAVLTALESPARVEEVFLSDGLPGENEIRRAASEQGVEVVRCPPSVVRVLAGTASPQGVVAVVGMPDTSAASLPRQISLALVLCGVSDPGNAGTLVRSAVAAAADAVVVTNGSVDPFGPKTVRASAATLLSTRIVILETMKEVALELRRRDVRLLGTAITGASVYTRELTAPVAFVLGNEAWGLPEDARPYLDDLISVPMPGPAESLNVGAAGAILMFEAVRQRRGPSGTSGGEVYPRLSDE